MSNWLDTSPITPPSSAELRESHHRLAKSIAMGMKGNDLTLATGFGPGVVGRLMKDESFKELVDFYSWQLEEDARALKEEVAFTGIGFIRELERRFKADRSEFLNSELMKYGKELLQMSVMPVNKNPQVITGGGAGVQLQVNFVSPEGKGENSRSEAIGEKADVYSGPKALEFKSEDGAEV
jgi:hypothetical protein